MYIVGTSIAIHGGVDRGSVLLVKLFCSRDFTIEVHNICLSRRAMLCRTLRKSCHECAVCRAACLQRRNTIVRARQAPTGLFSEAREPILDQATAPPTNEPNGVSDLRKPQCNLQAAEERPSLNCTRYDGGHGIELSTDYISRSGNVKQ